MELNRIERLLERYFEGETSIEEEKGLQQYFASENVAPHLEQYRSVFRYFSKVAAVESKKEIHLAPKLQTRKSKKVWLSVAASVVVMVAAGTYLYFDKTVPKDDLGTYDNPELAMKETQRALAMLSKHLNVGIESVIVLEKYEDSKKLIFKQ